MTKKRTTKRALLLSALSLLMCISMLMGTTYAWFTDSVTSAGNIIKSGSLDVEMYWKDASATGEQKTYVDASKGAIFNYDLWEPGYVEAKNIKICNVGTLALNYQLRVFANSVVSKLGDVIDVYYFDSEKVLTRDTVATGTKLGTLTEIFGTAKNLSNTICGELKAGEEEFVTIAFKMQESAGNEYQNLSIGSDFTVQLLATQLTYEKDSFDDQYDKDALSDGIPAAFVRELENKTINATIGIGGQAQQFTLNAAYKFEPTESFDELMKSEYKYYLADFIVSADRDVAADTIALAGYYDAWCQFNNDNWVALVNEGADIAAGTEIALVGSLGYPVHYKDICEYGNDGIGFLCGVSDLFGANAGTTITVKLCLFETEADPNGSSASGVKVPGAEPIVIGEFKYTFPKKADSSVDHYDYVVDDLDGLKKAFDEGGNVILSEDVQLEKITPIAPGKDVYLDLNGKTLTVDKNTKSNTLIWVQEGAKLTVAGNGTIDLGDVSTMAIFCPYGELVIENGTFKRNQITTVTDDTTGLFMGAKIAASNVTINGGYFDSGYYNADGYLNADLSNFVETDAAGRNKPGDQDKTRLAVKDNVSALLNHSGYGSFKVYGGTFVGANPAWGDEGCMLPTTPDYLRPWSYYQGPLLAGQTYHADKLEIPAGYTITESTLTDGRPVYTVEYNK